MNIQLFWTVAFLLLLLPPPALAFNLSEQVRISGFLSFGGGITDADAFPGGNDPNDPEDNTNNDEESPKYTAGSGRFILDDALSFEQDTRAGIQFDAQLNDTTAVTLQFVSKGYIDNYDPDLSWAYLSHKIQPDLTLRGGRFRLPIYLSSDYLDVGIAYTWISPPTEVYSTINMSNLTGIDLLYSLQIDNWILSAQPFLGTSEFERGDFTSEFRKLYGINSSLSLNTPYFGDLTVRVAYMEYEFSIRPWPLNDNHALLIQGLLQAGMDDLEEYHDPNEETTTFLTAGIQWQTQRWGVQSEWARRDNAEHGPDVDGHYITIHYQRTNWQPHITFAARKETDRGKRFHPDLDQLAILSPQLAAGVIGLINAGIGVEDNESESITIGINYIFNDSSVGKVEVSEVRNIESTGLFEFATKDDKNHILRFVVDVLF